MMPRLHSLCALALLCACTPPDHTSRRTYACETDADCLPGYTCRSAPFDPASLACIADDAEQDVSSDTQASDIQASDIQASDTRADNLDDDCDVEADEVCPTCTAGEACNTGGGCGGLPDAQCACKAGTWTCTEQGTPDQCLDGDGNPVVFPLSRSEIAGNGIDDDCDGTVD